LVIEGGLVRTSANCGIDASWMRGAVEFAGGYVLVMMLADVGIAVMMKMVMNDASFFGPAKAVYAACSQRRV
jgi:hypothetical protein